MGCDVHAFWEIKVNGKWLCYSQPNFKRDYRLFSKMAGVRQVEGITPISKPRGLPNDISEVVALEAKWRESDWHSHSWLNSKEIKELFEFHSSLYRNHTIFTVINEWFYLFRNNWADFDTYREDYPKEIEDIRLVFWFDN